MAQQSCGAWRLARWTCRHVWQLLSCSFAAASNKQPLVRQVSDGFSFQPHNSRVTFNDTAASRVWALVFPTLPAAEAFSDTYTHKLFENKHRKAFSQSVYRQVVHCKMLLPVSLLAWLTLTDLQQYGDDGVLGNDEPEGSESQNQWASAAGDDVGRRLSCLVTG